MTDIDMQTVMDLLHDACVVLKDQHSETWSVKWLTHIEATQEQMLTDYEFEVTE